MQVYTWWSFVDGVVCVPFIVESLSINYVTPSISRVWSLSWACSYIIGGECHCSLLTYIYAGCVFSTLLLSISTDSTFSTPLIGIETSSYVLFIIVCDWSCSSYEGITRSTSQSSSFLWTVSGISFASLISKHVCESSCSYSTTGDKVDCSSTCVLSYLSTF